MNKEQGILVCLVALGLSFFSPLTAASGEMSGAEQQHLRNQPIDATSLKAAYELRKSEIQQAMAPAQARARTATSTVAGEPQPLAETALANKAPDEVAAALRYDPAQLYHFLVAHPASDLQTEAVLDAAQAHLDQSELTQAERMAKSATLRGLDAVLKLRAEKGKTSPSQVVPLATGNITIRGQE